MPTYENSILSRSKFEEFINSVGKPQERLVAEGESVYPPEIDDLYSLYVKVRENKVVAIIEFGSGWSTLAMAKALDENRINHSEYVMQNIRHPNPFKLMTVDSSSIFQNLALSRIPIDLSETEIIPVISEARMTTVNGQICHVFDFIPPFTADFIYLDGPDCDQVIGDINGFSVRFGSKEYSYGLPMAADLILLEPYFWPGTLLVTDGRGGNANFLKNNFKRNWLYRYDEETDQHLFRLSEQPFGKISASMLLLKQGFLGLP